MKTRTEAINYAADWAESAHRALSRSEQARLNRAAGYPISADLPARELDTCRLELEFARTWAAIAAVLPEEPAPAPQEPRRHRALHRLATAAHDPQEPTP